MKQPTDSRRSELRPSYRRLQKPHGPVYSTTSSAARNPQHPLAKISQLLFAAFFPMPPFRSVPLPNLENINRDVASFLGLIPRVRALEANKEAIYTQQATSAFRSECVGGD